MSVDLLKLPEVSFAPTNAAEVEASVLTAYENLTGTTLQPGDPVRLFLESLAYVITVQNGLIDLAGKQNLLAYASGANLDHLGALMGVSRIPAQPAQCELEFSISEPLAFEVPVPAGTRAASADGRIVFATRFFGVIPAGETAVAIPALAQTVGADANGLVPGQIKSLVDPLPYITSVRNSTRTSEGSDREGDSRLRERIRMAPESFTVAGSRGQYEARVLEVSQDIEAVSVTSPEPGVVDVRFTLTGGILPDEAMCGLVLEHLSAEKVRPLTDNVLVGAPDIVEYAIDLSWYLKRSDASLLSSVTLAVEKAVESFRIWQRVCPGRDINPSALIAAIQDAGAKRVELRSPVFTELAPVQIARETSVNIAFGGMEDE